MAGGSNDDGAKSTTYQTWGDYIGGLLTGVAKHLDEVESYENAQKMSDAGNFLSFATSATAVVQAGYNAPPGGMFTAVNKEALNQADSLVGGVVGQRVGGFVGAIVGPGTAVAGAVVGGYVGSKLPGWYADLETQIAINEANARQADSLEARDERANYYFNPEPDYDALPIEGPETPSPSYFDISSALSPISKEEVEALPYTDPDYTPTDAPSYNFQPTLNVAPISASPNSPFDLSLAAAPVTQPDIDSLTYAQPTFTPVEAIDPVVASPLSFQDPLSFTQYTPEPIAPVSISVSPPGWFWGGLLDDVYGDDQDNENDDSGPDEGKAPTSAPGGFADGRGSSVGAAADGAGSPTGPHESDSTHEEAGPDSPTGDQSSWGGPGAYAPVVLDLDGQGLTIDALGSSSTFVDAEGDGYQQRTAWAGQGDGVLVYDADGDGEISRASEFDFMDWAPGASGDLEAIREAFDTNGNGTLDAGDAGWSKFKVSVDGQLVSLDSLGITSINLTPTGSGETFSDGSAITGTTTYTKSNGTTGEAADAILASDSSEYTINTSTTTAGDGSTTKTIIGYNPDGSLAFRELLTTSADGNTVTTQYDDDGNGTYDRSQSDVIAIAADGTKTETLSNFNADGSLLNRTITVTSADRSTVTTTVDQDGDGQADEIQIYTKNADGSSSTTTKTLAADGSILNQVVIQSSTDGLTKTTKTDANGDGVFEDVTTETTVINADGSRTKTVYDRSGNGSLISSSSTNISTDGHTELTNLDLDGNGTNDELKETRVTPGADGSTSSTTWVWSGNGTYVGQQTVWTSADGLTVTTSKDLDGGHTSDRVETVQSTKQADGTIVHTDTIKASDLALLSNTVTTTSADHKTITVTTDANGDGHTDSTVSTVVGSDGTTTKTATSFNGDGSTLNKTVAITAADGLSSTTKDDIDGDGVFDQVTTDVIVGNADGSRTETVKMASAGGQTISSTVTTTSADSLTQTAQSDLDGNGSVDLTVTDQITLAADGSRTETATAISTNGTLQSQVTMTTSADRKTVTVSSDLDGDGHADQTQVQTIAASGQSTTVVTRYTDTGVVIGSQTVQVSGDQLRTTTTIDTDGNGTVDRTVSDITTLNADGSKTETVSASSANGTVLSRSVTTTSGNGLSVTTTADLNGDGTIDSRSQQVKTLNLDGSTTTTTSSYLGSSLVSVSASTVSYSGLLTTTTFDDNGDGVVDRTVSSTKTLNANGSTTEVDTTTSANGTLTSKITTNISADLNTKTIDTDIDGDGVVDYHETVSVALTGVTTDTIEEHRADGTVSSRSVQTTSANGLSKTLSADLDGDGTYDQVTTDLTTLNADGSTTEVVTKTGAAGAPISKTTVAKSANGLSTTISWADATGTVARSESDVRTIGTDGRTTETVTYSKAGGALESKTVTTFFAHGSGSTVTRDINGDGVVDQNSVIKKNADGTTLTVLSDLTSTGTAADTTTINTSANGLHQTVDYDANGDGTAEKHVDVLTVLNVDGSTTVTTSRYNRGTSGLVLSGKSVVTTSADKLTVSTQWDTTGAGTFNKSETDTMVLNADGSRTRTVSFYAGSTLTSRYQTITSANGLTVTTKQDPAGTGAYSETAVDVFVLNADGSKTETVTTTKADGTVLSTTTSTTSANGLYVTATEQRAGLANQTVTSTTETLADGTARVTTTTTSATGTLLDKTVVTTSADGQTVTTDRDANGDGITDQHRQSVIADSGAQTITTVDYKSGGIVADRTVETVSADGRTTVIDWDFDGNGTNDRERVITDTANGDGSHTTVMADTDLTTNKLATKTTVQVSADGMVRTSSRDVDGDGTIDQVDTLTTDASGASVDIVTNNAAAQKTSNLSAGLVYWNQAIAAKVETDTTSDGRTTTTKYDFDGDGIFEVVMQTVLQADGSTVTSVTEKTAAGAIKATGTITTTADGLITTLSKDTDNNGTIDHTETAVTHADGSITLTKVDRNTDGTLKQTVVDTVNALGSLTLRVTTDGQGRKTAQTVVNADGSSVSTTYDAASGQVLSVSNANKAGLLTSAVLYDPLNAQPWTRVEQSFDVNGKKTLEKQYNDDGTRTEITFNVTSGAQSHIDYFNASNVRTASIDYDLANTAAWSRVQQNYDSAGRVTYRAEFNDNGTETAYTYDPANTATWSSITQTFNTSAQLTTQTQYNDNGTYSVTTFDPTNAQTWSRIDQNFDASNRRTYQLNTFDDGTKNAYTYDAANTASWSYIVQELNAAGQLTQQNQYNDDGTLYLSLYDPTNVQNWYRVDETYDSSNRETTQSNYYDNGTRQAWTWDQSNVQSWSSVWQLFNASGQMTNQTVINDDSSQTQYVWDVSNSQSWAYTADVYTAAGQHTTNYVYSDDPSKWTITSYDYNGSQPWTSLVQNFINSGHITTATSYNDDGSYTNYQYNSSGTLTAWQRWAFVSNGGGGSSGYKEVDYWPQTSGGHGPVLLDLNGDGHIDFRPLDENALATGSSPTFDWNGDGARDGTAWVGPQDGFLAIDLGEDGQSGPDGVIDQAKELSFSLWATDDQVAANGGEVSDLDGLRLAFDSNNDGILDANDDRWSEFRVWRDANQNGITDPGELETMSEAGIKLINLMPSTDGAQSFADGSAITGTSSYQTIDGNQYLVGDSKIMSQPAIPISNAA